MRYGSFVDNVSQVDRAVELSERSVRRSVVAVGKPDVGLIQPGTVEVYFDAYWHYTPVESLRAPSYSHTSWHTPIGLRLGSNEYVNGRLPRDFRNKVRPAPAKRTMAHANNSPIHAETPDIVKAPGGALMYAISSQTVTEAQVTPGHTSPRRHSSCRL